MVRTSCWRRANHLAEPGRITPSVTELLGLYSVILEETAEVIVSTRAAPDL